MSIQSPQSPQETPEVSRHAPDPEPAGCDLAEFARSDLVEVRIPADSAYLAVMRTVTAGLAARADLTLDDIEDLRIAVDEACTLLLRQARPGSDLVATFAPGEHALTIQLAVAAVQARLPERDSFAWQVLAALAGDVQAGISGDADEHSRLWLQLHKERERQ